MHLWRLILTVFGLFYSSVSCEKLKMMQMILVHRNANEFFFPSGIQLIILFCKTILTFTHFAPIFLDSLYHSSLPTYVWVVWIFLWTSWNILLVPSFSYHVKEYLWHIFHFQESWDPRKASETCHMRKCGPLISKQGTKRNFASIIFLVSE